MTAEQINIEVQALLTKYPNEVERYRHGKRIVLAFFVSELMRVVSRYEGNYADAAQVLIAELDKKQPV